MKNRYLVLTIIILSIVAIISSPNEETAFLNKPENKEKDMEVVIKDSNSNKETNMVLEEYVVGVVAGEMPASFNEEALRAQAIAARTYAVYKVNTTRTSYDLVSDVSNQVYITEDEMRIKWGNDFNKYYNKVKSAVEDTKGLVLKYNGEVISSYYFSMSNGKTEDVSLVFGESRDYLKSVDSSWDSNINNFSVTKAISKKEFCNKLGINCNNIKIGAINRSSSNRVNTIVINNKTFKGTEVRTKLGLRSTDFTIVINDEVLITTKGYGHGVGMSQYGANEMAKNGKSYEDILKYYYQGITIEKNNV